MGDAETALLVFEKFYFRNNSYSSLTIEITSYDSLQKAVVIGSGGGESLFNLSNGVNSNFAKRAYAKLKELGFEGARVNPGSRSSVWVSQKNRRDSPNKTH